MINEGTDKMRFATVDDSHNVVEKLLTISRLQIVISLLTTDRQKNSRSTNIECTFQFVAKRINFLSESIVMADKAYCSRKFLSLRRCVHR